MPAEIKVPGFDAMDPKPYLISIKHIASRLANKPLFDGRGSFFSYAQHAVLMKELVEPGLEKQALLYNAIHAYLDGIPQHIQGAAHEMLASRIQAAIAARFALGQAQRARMNACGGIGLEEAHGLAWAAAAMAFATPEYFSRNPICKKFCGRIRTAPKEAYAPDAAEQMFLLFAKTF